MTPGLSVLEGDWIARLAGLGAGSVHCCVTSPPYWGLRDYRVEGQLGLEKTFEEYVAKVVAGFREVRRVLRDDGTLWVNLGDCYSAQAGQRKATDARGPKQCTNRGSSDLGSRDVPGLKPKDLCGIPWRVAFALQADGWYLRQDIVWHKPNVMPESVTDRPTRAHEYVFLLSKAARYFYDAEAVKEAVTGGAKLRTNGKNSRMVKERALGAEDSKPNPSSWNKTADAPEKLIARRNARSVWTIASQAYHGNHYATFPEELARRCILAGTSARGVCPKCGAPWVRILEKPEVPVANYDGKYQGQDNRGANLQRRLIAGRAAGGDHDHPWPDPVTIGWEASCDCQEAAPVPATVLDPFGGSGTTGRVALEHGRHAILIELNPDSVRQIRERTSTTPGLALA